MLNLCWIILGLPLFAAALIALFLIPMGKKSADKKSFHSASTWISTGAIAVSFILSFVLLNQFRAGENTYGQAIESSLPWIALGEVKIEIGLLLNPLALLMLLVVTGVAALVSFFSIRYMQSEEGRSRYFASLSFFVFAMLGIVLANNLIQLFIFWELVGVASYLLIGFWFEKKSASDASKKAFLTTRVGDVGMMLGILLLFGLLAQSGAGTFNFLELETRLPQSGIPANLLSWACLGIFLGAVGKSAQAPLHVWLPDAMEGPTPASALIHAATMVAAGVYMLARLFFLFEMSPVALSVIAWTGVTTAFLAATMAIVQNDVKRVLAYSTLSQLGYMVMAVGLKSPEAGMFHLVTHAFFKALLFLAAGSLIHALHTQDIWQLRLASSSPSLPQKNKNLLSQMPITAITFFIGTAALMGVPFTSGFFSKEEILGAATHGPRLLFFVALAVVFLTAYYMGRVITVVFFSASKNDSQKKSLSLPHEDNALITLPLIILAVLSLIAGYLPFHSFLHAPLDALAHPSEWLAWLSVALAFCGFATAFFLYRNKSEDKHIQALQIPVRILEQKYFFDRFYDWLVTSIQENLARAAAFFERHVLVELLTRGLARLSSFFSYAVRQIQNGWVQKYGLAFAAGWTGLLIYLIFYGGRV